MPRNDKVSIQTSTTVIAAGASAILSPANPRREFILVRNAGANAVLLEFGRPTNANSYSLAAGAEKLFEQKVPIDSINVSSAAGSNVLLWEGMTA